MPMHIRIFFILMVSMLVALPAQASTLIPVPFSSQAPRSDWKQPWFDACEETSVTMVDLYYNPWQRTDSSLTISVTDAEAHILKFFSRKEQLFGTSFDEPVQKLAQVINNYYSWEAYTVFNPTIDQLKAELDAKRPIIVPASGKELQNPRFRNGGPPFHMFVLSGYDNATQQFIAQEPGTQYGHNYTYSYATVLNAMHDYVPNDISQGAKVVLFTRPTVTDLSAHLDIDNDGLSKKDELQHGTNLSIADTDNDGFSDGYEVQKGYSPLLNEKAIRSGHLVKMADDPKVYLVQGDTIQHIATEFVFLSRGYRWSEIKTISQAFLETFTVGSAIYQ